MKRKQILDSMEDMTEGMDKKKYKNWIFKI